MLDFETSSKGTQAVKEAIHEITGHRGSNFAEAIAIVSASVKRKKVIDREEIRVHLRFDGTNYSTIEIFWEDYGYKNYRDMGLYGSMNTQFNKVEKVDVRTLIIHDPNYEIEIEY